MNRFLEALVEYYKMATCDLCYRSKYRVILNVFFS
jgi:hypothetical protein